MPAMPQWYLRSAAHADAHHGQLHAEGTLTARCGLVFRPEPELFGTGPATLHPPITDGDIRCCPACRTARDTSALPSSPGEQDAAALWTLMDRL